MKPQPLGLTRVGNFFGSQGIALAEKTVNNFINQNLRFHEQEPALSRSKRLGDYIKVVALVL